MTATIVESEITSLEEFEFGIPCEMECHEKHGKGDAEWVLTPVKVLPCGCQTANSLLSCLACLERLRKRGFLHGVVHYTFTQVVARVVPISCPPSDG